MIVHFNHPPPPQSLIDENNRDVSDNFFRGSIANNSWLCNVENLDMSFNYIDCPLLSCCSETVNGGCVMSPEIPCYDLG